MSPRATFVRFGLRALFATIVGASFFQTAFAGQREDLKASILEIAKAKTFDTPEQLPQTRATSRFLSWRRGVPSDKRDS